MPCFNANSIINLFSPLISQWKWDENEKAKTQLDPFPLHVDKTRTSWSLSVQSGWSGIIIRFKIITFHRSMRKGEVSPHAPLQGINRSLCTTYGDNKEDGSIWFLYSELIINDHTNNTCIVLTLSSLIHSLLKSKIRFVEFSGALFSDNQRRMFFF